MKILLKKSLKYLSILLFFCVSVALLIDPMEITKHASLEIIEIVDTSPVRASSLPRCDMTSPGQEYTQGDWTLPLTLESIPEMAYSPVLRGLHCYNSSNKYSSRLARSLLYKWNPYSCHLSEYSASGVTRVLASRYSGGILMVGDSLLRQLSTSLENMYPGNSIAYKQAMILVNFFTLKPMTPAEHTLCERQPEGLYKDTDTYCLPKTTDSVHFEHKTEYQLWTRSLDEMRPATVILETGPHWWREVKFASKDFPAGTSAFEVKYPIMVRNIVDYLNAQAFVKNVVFFTFPWGAPGCEKANIPKDILGIGIEKFKWDEIPKHEHLWGEAFAKRAPRIRFFYLNVTQLSRQRGDAHDPPDCLHFCLPGVPDTWSQLLFNLLEQI